MIKLLGSSPVSATVPGPRGRLPRGHTTPGQTPALGGSLPRLGGEAGREGCALLRGARGESALPAAAGPSCGRAGPVQAGLRGRHRQGEQAGSEGRAPGGHRSGPKAVQDSGGCG